MIPLEKALLDIDLFSRNNKESSSIRFGKWIGYEACKNIVKTLIKDIEEEKGMCRDCKHSRPVMKIIEPRIWCDVFHLERKDTFYCGDFERKDEE